MPFVEPLRVDIVGCARCLADGHENLLFRPLTNPMVGVSEGEPTFTHWAMCPDTIEPVMLRLTSPEFSSDPRGDK